MIFITSLFDSYKIFPKIDCGYCGNPSCITLLRKKSLDEASLSECIYFKYGICEESAFSTNPPQAKVKPGPSISFINPCPSASELVTVEVNFSSPESSKHGYFDMVTAEKIYGQAVPGLRVSSSLGLARFEVGGRAIMGFSKGRVLVRRAIDEADAFFQLCKFARWFWAAVN